jgi:transcription elongation GreA/GreB family factor
MKKQEENQVYDSLLGKLSQLKKEMEDIRDKLKMARLDGDLSENAD